MGKIQVSTPKGVREFSPRQVYHRNNLLTIFRTIFEQYGFAPFETGAMENLSVLEGKYGDEGDRLLFRILNSGDYLEGVQGDLREMPRKELTRAICDKGLRYDLTVPFARYVATHWQELPHPFKRYQIQPVWRADRPQKGRYREFLQCDVDVVGSPSLLNEVELLSLVAECFYELGIRIDIHINSRLILEDIAEQMGHPELLVPMTVVLDKLDKIGNEAVKKELEALGFSSESVSELLNICAEESVEATLEKISAWLPNTPKAQAHLADILGIMDAIYPFLHALTSTEPSAYLEADRYCWPDEIKIHFTPSLARGLSYYTGVIFEVTARDANMGAICSGGRYDNLTELFGLKDVCGVGLSFGIERIFDILSERPEWDENYSMVDLLCGGEDDKQLYCSLAISRLARLANLRTLLLPDATKLKKRLEYADKNHIRWVLIDADVDTVNIGMPIKVRDMDTGQEYKDDCEVVLTQLSEIKDEELDD